ncbi:Uncharacterised protein [Mycobacterium tuberculosis]|nr:Uncharacterised protein [Mycobacterium tuberculosis]COW93620.1 Uncharacterised protein [Mycobacterium tuberculosis]
MRSDDSRADERRPRRREVAQKTLDSVRCLKRKGVLLCELREISLDMS